MTAALRTIRAAARPGGGDLAQVAQLLLGPDVAVAGGSIGDWTSALHPDEAGAVARAVPARRAEFAAGRAAARAAMARLGHPAVPLLRRADGPPLWPAGLTGSLSHGGGQVLAAVMPGPGALGLDIEPVVPLAPGLAAEICRPDEERGAALRVFGAKEAAYKALYMIAARPLGFAALRVTLRPGGFAAELMERAGPLAPGLVVAGAQATLGGFLLSAVRLAPTP
jgi:4'-phosphopantetheinyl transferase EntD